jgi:hypothetical protein
LAWPRCFGAIALVLGAAIPAQAYTSTVGGQFNRTGSTVHYKTTRYTQGSATILDHLSRSAGSPHGGYYMELGVTVPNGPGDQGLNYMGVSTYLNATLSSTYWLKDTAFKTYGDMPVSNGPCQPYFNGTLYF